MRVRATVEAVDRTGVEMEAMIGGERRRADRLRHDQERRPLGDDRRRPARGEERRQERRRDAAGGAGRDAARVALLREQPLSLDEAVAHVKHAGAGAVCVFLGMVRDHNDGRPVVRLEYEAYASMALAEMTRIAEEIEAETPRRAARGAPPHRARSSWGTSPSSARRARRTAARRTRRAARSSTA